MPRFAANLSMMFQEHPFLDRFAAAAACGFRGVEFLFPYDHPAETIAETAARAGVEIVLFNMPPGDFAGGERGLASLPGREAEVERGIATALAYARILGVTRLHMMAGLLPEESLRPQRLELFRRSLAKAAAAAAPQAVRILVEAINTRDIPGYLLNRQDDALAQLDAVAAPNTALQLDLYHRQIMEGDLAAAIRRLLPRVGHIQIAGTPGRHEPDLGEVNYPFLFDLLDELGYAGWIGCEYRPRAGTREGLGWAARWGIGG
mgnify:FL=1